MKSLIFIFLCIFTTSSFARSPAWKVQKRINLKTGKETVLSVKPMTANLEGDVLLVKDLPEFLEEGPRQSKNSQFKEEIVSQEYFVRHFSRSSALGKFLNKNFPIAGKSEADKLTIILETFNRTVIWPNSEVRTLINQGPSANRIDLTIVGDGYTLAEKEKFFADSERITKDMFEGNTFKTYLALFNVHAVFVPSQESGVSDTKQVNTALGLYRSPKGSKRAVMPGKFSEIEKAVALAPDADYPILVANDDYYGGLGGRYAITTRSLTSGTMVLRHELGHNFSNVGEEYDGGSVYSGANSSSTTNVPWSYWTKGVTDVFESKMLSGEYLWKNLKDGILKSTFQFPQGNYLFDIQISSVGWKTEQDVLVTMDGSPREIDGVYTEDRSFFTWKYPETLTPGTHVVEFKENIKDGDNVLAFSRAYAHPANINRDKHNYAAYPTFNDGGRKSGYRPTYDTCLMRDMRSTEFCSVDIENMWIRFLNVATLVDKIEVQTLGDKKVAKVITPNLPLKYTWYENTGGSWKVLPSKESTLEVSSASTGTYQVEVEFLTPEVRKPGIKLKTTKQFQL